MKKNFLWSGMAALALLFTASCSNEEVLTEQESSEALVSFTLEQPGIQSRAFSDGKTATNLTYAVYESGETTPLITSVDEVTFVNKKATVNLRLAKGKTYDLVFWADAPDAPYTFNATTQSITVDYAGAKANDEKRDAFFAAEAGLVVTGPVNKDITLKRPFAQLNIGASDYAAATTAGFTTTQTKVVVKDIYNTLNLLDGTVSGNAEVTFDMAAVPANGEAFPKSGVDVDYLTMNYFLVPAASELVTVDFTATNGSTDVERTYSNIPVQRNYRTNIFGNILTEAATFNVEISEGYNLPANDFNFVVDGISVNEDGSYNISSPAGLAYASSNMFANGGKFILTGDIDMSGVAFTPATVRSSQTLEIDGNGHAITNLTVENTDLAAFIGENFSDVNIHDLTIKNSTFTGTTSPSTGGKWVCATFLGWKNEGGLLTLTNCVSENNTLNSTKYVAGLVGYHSAVDDSGITTITGCKVKGCTLKSFYSEDGGITFKGHAGGLVGLTNVRLNVTGNTVESVTIQAGDAGSSSSRQGAIVGSISQSESNVVVTGNTVKNTTIKGTMVTTEDQLVGQVKNGTYDLSGNTITND